MDTQIDSGSATLLSLAGLFIAGAGGFMQTNFIYSAICAVIAVICIVAREYVKK